MNNNWIVWLTILVMLVGVAGTFLPILPGLVMIFCAALAYGIYDNFNQISPYIIIVLGILTAFGTGVDYFAGAVGAKQSGASKAGSWGAVLGGLVGLFFFPWGIIFFPPVGVILGELAVGKSLQQAIRAAWGTCLGLLGGAVAKILIALLMTGLFIWDLFI